MAWPTASATLWVVCAGAPRWILFQAVDDDAAADPDDRGCVDDAERCQEQRHAVYLIEGRAFVPPNATVNPLATVPIAPSMRVLMGGRSPPPLLC